jgi:hypothetical protein
MDGWTKFDGGKCSALLCQSSGTIQRFQWGAVGHAITHVFPPLRKISLKISEVIGRMGGTLLFMDDDQHSSLFPPFSDHFL